MTIIWLLVGLGLIVLCPELVVSLTGAFEGNADIAIGNVVGSNIFNVLFILGLTSLVCPVSMTKGNRKKDIPLTLIVTLLFLALGLNHTFWGIGKADCLSRWEGTAMLLLFGAYYTYLFINL